MFKFKAKKQTRRGAVRKTEQRPDRRRLFAIAGASVFVVIIGVLGWQLRHFEMGTFLPIERVRIEGNFKNLATKTMQAQVVSVLQGGYFTVNLEAIRDALLQMPWVGDVSVRRDWPPSLDIHVTEKTAVAYWGKDSLISDKGELFTPQPLSHQLHLPELDGPDQLHKKVWQFAAEVSSKLIKLGMHTVKVSLNDRRAWRVYVVRDGVSDQQNTNLIEVNFGSTDIEKRLHRFLRVFAMNNAPSLNDVQVIDMRYPNGFALRSRSADKREA
jgi:cell division protein FtsQ